MPKPETNNIKTQADLIALIREMGTSQMTALQGLMDKVPANLKSEYEVLRSKMNGLLEKLPPLDSVPAASEAAWALNSFARTITELFEYVDVFRTKIGGMADALAEKTTALHGLNERIEKKELVDKATLQAAADTAVNTALKPLQATISAMRKQQVALCGLPEAPEAILGGTDDAFSAAMTQAQANLKVCAGCGFKIDGPGKDFIKRTVWLEQTAFQGENQTLTDLAETLKIKIPAGGDPFIGGTGAGGDPKQQTETSGGRKLTLA